MISKKRKRIKIKLIVEAQTTVPKEWDKDMIEFHYNRSSHCLTNELENLCEKLEKLKEDNCLCNILSAEYVGDVDDF